MAVLACRQLNVSVSGSATWLRRRTAASRTMNASTPRRCPRVSHGCGCGGAGATDDDVVDIDAFGLAAGIPLGLSAAAAAAGASGICRRIRNAAREQKEIGTRGVPISIRLRQEKV